MSGWEDRLSADQCAAVDATLRRFKTIRRPAKHHEHQLYADLTDAGLYSEEADEMVSLTLPRGH